MSKRGWKGQLMVARVQLSQLDIKNSEIWYCERENKNHSPKSLGLIAVVPSPIFYTHKTGCAKPKNNRDNDPAQFVCWWWRWWGKWREKWPAVTQRNSKSSGGSTLKLKDSWEKTKEMPGESWSSYCWVSPFKKSFKTHTHWFCCAPPVASYL